MIPRGGRLHETITLASDRDVVKARRAVSKAMDGLNAGALRKTRLVTAVSEIARNAVVHAGGGELRIFRHEHPLSLSVICEDSGPGIADIPLALSDGYSTAGSLGRGLGGARRLVSEFEIDSVVDSGTTVRMLGMA